MNRVLLAPGAAESGTPVPLDEAESHHLRVRRSREGELVSLRDGAGLMGTGRLVLLEKGWGVEINAAERHPRPADLTLAIGGGDRERFAWAVEKAVELGVTAIVPLETVHTAGVGGRLQARHISKLRRQALEALKQCGAVWAPTIEDPVQLRLFLERAAAGTRWLAEAMGQPPPDALDGAPLTVVIGPEGGLVAEERAVLTAAGYLPVSLGLHTLRFETAAIAAAAAVSAARLRGNHG
ncbi:MAG: RsmE family RNA methyltransferase [Gemmatimonadales bacterium]